MKRTTHLRIRKTHRYLGLLTGLQFIMWSVGGLYFSWSDIDEIHGDHQRKHGNMYTTNMELVSPTQVLKQLPQADSIISVRLINILGEPVYQIGYLMNSADHHMQHMQLANAATGTLRKPLSKEEAVAMATGSFADKTKVRQVEYLTKANINGHHEYRESPLPAWAVTMEHPTETTVYVAAEQGMVTKFRNNKWRVFDFLWMMHTMDYEGRDNFGNILLRLFSVIGLVTILSGFALYFVSTKRFKLGSRTTNNKTRHDSRVKR